MQSLRHKPDIFKSAKVVKKLMSRYDINSYVIEKEPRNKEPMSVLYITEPESLQRLYTLQENICRCDDCPRHFLTGLFVSDGVVNDPSKGYKLEFSYKDEDKAEKIDEILKENDFDVISTWAMGSTLEDIKDAGNADVNLVISYSGMGAAKYMYEKFNIPYIVGTPFGKEFAKKIVVDLKEAIITKENKISYINRKIDKNPQITIIGESIMSESLAYAISTEKNKTVNVISTLETDKNLLLEGDKLKIYEDDIEKELKNSKIIIADPLYRPICPLDSNFISLPHEGFSGRIYRDEIPNLINKSL